MSAPERITWRASNEFGTALIARHAEEAAFINEVIRPWNEAHAPVKAFLASDVFSLDRAVVIPKLPDGTVPEGLSASSKRRTLIPVRGKAGNAWRAELAKLNKMPSTDEVFTRFDVPVHVRRLDRVYRAGMHLFGRYHDTVYLSCGADLLEGKDHPHLTPIPLSEFYRAKEITETADAAAQKAREVNQQ